jgi:hypothetical protein
MPKALTVTFEVHESRLQPGNEVEKFEGEDEGPRVTLVLDQVDRAPLRDQTFFGCWSYVNGQQSDLPIIALTTINRRPVALSFFRIAALELDSFTPFSIFPYFISSRTYSVWAALIGYAKMLFDL